jgi:hypothetical protein
VPLEVWAIDLRAGAALLRTSESWFEVALDRGWRLEPLSPPDELAQWVSQYPSAIAVGLDFASLEPALASIREACRIGFEEALSRKPGKTTTRATPKRAPKTERSWPSRLEFIGRKLRQVAGNADEPLHREVILAEGPRIARHFLRLGLPKAKATHQAALAFDRLWRSSRGWTSVSEFEALLFAILRELSREFRHPPEIAQSPLAPGQPIVHSRLAARLRERGSELPEPARRALWLWLNAAQPREVEVTLQLDAGEALPLVKASTGELSLTSRVVLTQLFQPTCLSVLAELVLRDGATDGSVPV